MVKRDPENIIKGAIGEKIAEEMFKELGFFVMKLGKEHTVNPLTQLENFIKSCKGNFCLEKLDFNEIREITHVNVLPDFVVVHPSGKTTLLEIKFRWNGLLYPKDNLVFSTYPEAHMLVINLQVNDNLIEIGDKSEQKIFDDELKNARFHIWFMEDCTQKEDLTLSVCSLEKWLKEEFKLENGGTLDKYQDLTKKWLGNEEVFKKIDEKQVETKKVDMGLG